MTISELKRRAARDLRTFAPLVPITAGLYFASSQLASIFRQAFEVGESWQKPIGLGIDLVLVLVWWAAGEVVARRRRAAQQAQARKGGAAI